MLLLFFCNVEQSTYIENSTDPILPCLEVGAIFFKYRDVIKAATCFCVMITINGIVLTFVGSVSKNRFELDFIEF